MESVSPLVLLPKLIFPLRQRVMKNVQNATAPATRAALLVPGPDYGHRKASLLVWTNANGHGRRVVVLGAMIAGRSNLALARRNARRARVEVLFWLLSGERKERGDHWSPSVE